VPIRQFSIIQNALQSYLIVRNSEELFLQIMVKKKQKKLVPGIYTSGHAKITARS